MTVLRRLQLTILLVVSIACAWLTAARLHVASDLSALFPESGDAGALARWTRAAGGRDPAVVLVRGPDPESVAGVATDLAEALKNAPSIRRVVDGGPTFRVLADPTLAWAQAGPKARARLAGLVTPEGMRSRLEETRSLLLAPVGAEDAEAWVRRDPLRLAQVPWEDAPELAAGIRASPGEAFVADGGRARLVVAEPRGSAFTSAEARAVVGDVESAMAVVARPSITMELAGGHAIALATEQMLKHDLALSGALSLLLTSAAFVLTFRRARALAAVLPPLALGTLWTTGLAALLPAGLSGVSLAFAAVVVGVGVDTGVHVYSALLDARRAGLGATDAARAAREATWRPTLTAATVAGVAFASLALSGLRAMRELGLLCGAGEILTAVAILWVTPEIGAWMERGAPPAPRPSAWVEWLVRCTSTGRRATVALAVCAAPIAIVALVGWPRPADALVAIRPSSLAPLTAADHVRALFGGQPGEWVVLSIDPEEDAARRRADRVAEALEPLIGAGQIDGFDALATFAPSAGTRAMRLAERDRLDLPARRGALESALRDGGFDVKACAPALDAFAAPGREDTSATGDRDAALGWLRARHVARDGRETLVATFVRVHKGSAERTRAAILSADPRAVITGFDSIDRGLRDALGRDLGVVGGAALVIVAVGMRLALRSARQMLVALATLVCELGVVGLAMRMLAVRWHVYDALVLPVLFGVTIDESMFLLYATRDGSIRGALEHQGPLIAATALTTSAGFAALIACRFPGLRDLGVVGTVGVLAGLVAALVVVPSALLVMAPRDRPSLNGPLRRDDRE
ncbi:MAG TPA: MMPL family transporter [Polyangiaceae bacterium]|nr:MMPL family transporter [Polyangiaceae bacterium]